MEPNGWWKKWKLEEPPFPVGTRFELEAIELDGTRRPVALALAALVAAWIPSRRAMGIEPATALRAE